MRKSKRHIIAMFLTLVLVVTCSTSFQGASASNDTITTSAEIRQLTKIYESVKFVEYDELISKGAKIDDGMTVIYGNNIDTRKLFPASDTENAQGTKTHNLAEPDPMQNTYMAICMKHGGRVDVQYVSVSRGDCVDSACIDAFINSQLAENNLSGRINRFISDQITDSTSAYNSGTISTQASPSTRVVLNVKDTNYHIDNYVLASGRAYPLLMYRKDITYQALLVANELEDDLYVVVAFVNVTPGTKISSFTQDELNSIEGASLYNRTYGNAIAIKGIRTIFEDKFPDVDYFIHMSPNSGLTNVNNKTISVSLGLPPSVSVSFDVVTDSLSRIDMTTSFEARGKCTVQFEAFKILVGSPCISTDPFSYTAGVYMYSGGNVLYTTAATDILYYFQPSGPDSAVWSGSLRELYYENN